ncbi:MAG: FTR1 family protein [Acidobacteriota bacterium]|nr:FTR1 family protein [Acidobacteriota bacterium]
MYSLRRFTFALAFFPIIVGIAVLFVPIEETPEFVSPAPGILVSEDPNVVEPEKLIFLLQYLGTDYGAAVESGQIVSEFEYQEMLEFSQLLVENYQQLDPEPEILDGLQNIQEIIHEKGEWGALQAIAQKLLPLLAEQLHVISYPNVVPSLSHGREIYRIHCIQCHGSSGDGDGPAAKDLDPAPRSFMEERMNHLAPHQVYNAVTFGIEGTEMPTYLDSLRDQERWDVAFFVLTFRQSFNPVVPKSVLPVSLKDLATHTNEELVSKFSGQGMDVHLNNIDYYRENPPGSSLGELLLRAEQKLEKGKNAYDSGNLERALRFTLDAYLEGVEPVEPALKQRDGGLATQLETQFWLYRTNLRSNGSPVEIASSYESLKTVLRTSREVLEDSETESWFTFVQSFTIILREGIEAALLLGFMMTYLVSSGKGRLNRYIGLGAILAILAGIISWWIVQAVLAFSPLEQEALEGLVALLAAAVLFSVVFWVIHQVDIKNWKDYIRKKSEEAVGARGALVLVLMAFLVVYREAVETILFYEALWMRSREAQSTLVVLGFISGTAVLVILIGLMFKFGVRIPLKPFFALTGILLSLLTVVFAGYGVHELQTIGWIKETPLLWMSAIPVLEIRPTLETCVLQLGILMSIVMGWGLLGRTNRSAKSAP